MDDVKKQLYRAASVLNRIDEIYYHAAKTLGTTENMLALLYALNDGQEHTQKQISREWLIPKTTVNTLVQTCVAEGYIRLEQRAREKVIRLTERGRRYADALLEPLYAAERAALEAASPALVPALEQFAQRLQSEFDRQMAKGEDHESTH